jgi:hypothetical protein
MVSEVVDITKVRKLPAFEHFCQELGPLHCVPKRELTLEQTVWLTKVVSSLEMGTPWWVGDILNWAEGMGSEYDEAVQQYLPNHNPNTLMNYRRVSAVYSPGERVEGLSFATHMEVASEEYAGRRADLLAVALRERWSSKEFRSYLRGLEGGSEVSFTAKDYKFRAVITSELVLSDKSISKIENFLGTLDVLIKVTKR